MKEDRWVDLGPTDQLCRRELQEVVAGRVRIALTFRDNRFSAVSGVCNHVGGPLGQGALEGDYLVCPWHGWKFHCRTGEGEPGYESDRVPRFDLEERDGPSTAIDIELAAQRRAGARRGATPVRCTTRWSNV